MNTLFSKNVILKLSVKDDLALELAGQDPQNVDAYPVVKKFENLVSQRFLIIPCDDSGQAFSILCCSSGLLLSHDAATIGNTNNDAQQYIELVNEIEEKQLLRPIPQGSLWQDIDEQKFELEPLKDDSSSSFYVKCKGGSEYLSLFGSPYGGGSIDWELEFSGNLWTISIDEFPAFADSDYEGSAFTIFRLALKPEVILDLNDKQQKLTFLRAAELLILFSDTTPNPWTIKLNPDLSKIIEEIKNTLAQAKDSVVPSKEELARFYTAEDTHWYRQASASQANSDTASDSSNLPSSASSSAPPSGSFAEDWLYPSLSVGLGAIGILCFMAGPMGIVAAASIAVIGGGLSIAERASERSKAMASRADQIRQSLLRAEADAARYNKMMDYLNKMDVQETLAIREAANSVVETLEEYIHEEHIQDKLESVLSRVEELHRLTVEMVPDLSKISEVMTQGFNPNWVDEFRTKSTVLSPESLGQVWVLIDSDEFKVFEDLPDDYKSVPLDLKLAYNPTPANIIADTFSYSLTIIVNAIVLYSLVCLLPEEALRPNWQPGDCQIAADNFERIPIPENLSIPNQKTALNCFEFLYDNLNEDSLWMQRLNPTEGDAAKAYSEILNRLNQVSVNFDDPQGLKDSTLGSSSIDLFAEPYRTHDTSSIAWSDSRDKRLIDAVLWLGLILVNYAAVYKFKLDTESQETSYTAAYLNYYALQEIQNFAHDMLEQHQTLKNPEMNPEGSANA